MAEPSKMNQSVLPAIPVIQADKTAQPVIPNLATDPAKKVNRQ